MCPAIGIETAKSTATKIQYERRQLPITAKGRKVGFNKTKAAGQPYATAAATAAATQMLGFALTILSGVVGQTRHAAMSSHVQGAGRSRTIADATITIGIATNSSRGATRNGAKRTAVVGG